MNEHAEFVLMKAPSLLEKLEKDTPARWGQMNAQQMLEHIILTVKIANGKLDPGLGISQEEAEKKKELLLSDRLFERNMHNPLMPAKPRPAHYPSFEDARNKLLNELEDMKAFMREHSGAMPVHPLFGALTLEEWLLFHHNHIMHHFSQFGLI
ncbi:MAG: DUF1569 domain-containing protein [Bacteroidia bacterium]